uniref:G-protein coupled receptors family 1 profile domain-containing protein n=1 Tax=Strigamia maritima TaxID=126957 RepID=T1IT58_STRMM
MDHFLDYCMLQLCKDLSHQQLVNISPNAFQGLRNLLKLTTDEFRFCCLARHVTHCLPKADEFSSCEDLMSNIMLRICIWVLGLIAFTGNILVIIWRVIYRTNNKVHSFLITNLAIGDMCMGVYMLIIASVDTRYRGMYFIYDSLWRTSELCQFAGFVSTFSSELSVLTLTAATTIVFLVITLDRFVGIAFPFRMKRLKMHHTRVVMTVLWLIVTFLAGLPLANLEYFNHFYGRSGVCLALHITNEKPSGWEYSVFIFLALNLLSFTTISAAYLWMFLIARNTQMAVRSPEVKRDNTMARRMSLIVFTDFCCWMPIILLGILSLSGVTVPPQVFAWIAVFVLPLNAAINPVLYTLSTAPFLERKNIKIRNKKIEGPTRKRVSRFRRSFMTSITIDAYRTGTSVVDEPYTDNIQAGRRSVRVCSSARTLGASGTREVVHLRSISDEKGSKKNLLIIIKFFLPHQENLK